MTRYPKLLPWLARRHDLPVELAENLWRIALGEAVEATGVVTGPDVDRFALERFLDLLENEASGLGRMMPPPTTEWFWRHQRRMATLSFSATNATCRWWDAFWQRGRAQRLHA